MNGFYFQPSCMNIFVNVFIFCTYVQRGTYKWDILGGSNVTNGTLLIQD